MLYGIVFISLAFVLYTVAVWSEKIQGELKKWHLCLFWFGVLCDTLGTLAMGTLPNNHVDGAIDFHSLTGLIALVLMLLHVCWGTIIIFNKQQGWIEKFHRYSLIVWLIWLIPFISGVISHVR